MLRNNEKIKFHTPSHPLVIFDKDFDILGGHASRSIIMICGGAHSGGGIWF